MGKRCEKEAIPGNKCNVYCAYVCRAFFHFPLPNEWKDNRPEERTYADYIRMHCLAIHSKPDACIICVVQNVG